MMKTILEAGNKFGGRIVLSLVLVLALGFANVLNGYAEEETIAVYDVYEDTSQYDEINEYLIQRGREILANPQSRATVKLSNIKRLKQADSRWAEVEMQTTGDTIGKAGCCLTSFTMVRNLISSKSDTPATVNTALGDNACPFKWQPAADIYGYTILTAVSKDNGISDESARLNVVGAIDEYSRPAIIGLKNNSGTHFVVGYGYTSEGDIIICDPAGRNYTMLSQYFDEGYFVHRLYVYSR
ncbi:MAG: hypothetical protein K2K10_02890 [Acetatifactor sp.]|nr:hypothetical protein [Acetatifactor sp.]